MFRFADQMMKNQIKTNYTFIADNSCLQRIATSRFNPFLLTKVDRLAIRIEDSYFLMDTILECLGEKTTATANIDNIIKDGVTEKPESAIKSST